MRINERILNTALLCLITVACSTTPATKPLNDKATVSRILAKDPASPAFNQYLSQQGLSQESIPLKAWDIDTLTLSALFHHTKLDVAKQELALAKLAIKSAGVKKPPIINAEIAHSNQKNDDIKPWAYGLSLDIPIATNNKRSLKVAKAERDAESAQLHVAALAWQLRHNISKDLTAYYQTQAEIKLLQDELAIQESISNMLKKRVNAGIASRTELSNAQLLALKAKHLLANKLAQSKLIETALAADVGLSPEKFASIPIQPLQMSAVLSQQATILEKPIQSKAIQEQALLNRIDIRKRIAQYEAAETEIKLQAAKQIPDITLSPGILFEFGDKIWSLGFSSLLNMLQKNTVLIEEAKQLREIQGAAFENLQAEIIAAANQARVKYITAKETMLQAEQQLDEQNIQTNKMQKQFDAGLIGKLDITRYKRNTLMAKQHLIAAQFALLKVSNEIENVMQKPLYTHFKMPPLTTTEPQ